MAAIAGPSQAFMRHVSRTTPLAGMASTGPDQLQIARFILSKAGAPVGPSKPKEDMESSSALGWLFDKLSRSNYAVAEFAREWAATGDPDASALWEGFSGKKKTTYSDFLAEVGMDEGPLRSALGLGLDIFADPLTYVPVAGAVAKIRQLKGAKTQGKPFDVMRGVDDVPPKPGEPVPVGQKFPVGLVPPRAQALPVPQRPRGIDIPFTPVGKIDVPVGQQVLPGMEVLKGKAGPALPPRQIIPDEVPTPPSVRGLRQPSFADVPVGFPKLQKKWQLKELQKAVAPKAENIVEGLAQGSKLAAAKVAPKAMPETRLSKTTLDKAAAEIIAKFPPKSTSELVKKNPNALSAQQQKKYWHEAQQRVQKRYKDPESGRWFKRGPNKTYADALHIHKAIEATLKQAGKIPMVGSTKGAQEISLNEVAVELFNQGIKLDDKLLKQFSGDLPVPPGSPMDNALKAASAKSAVGEAPKVQKITEEASESIVAAKTGSGLSDNQVKDFEDFLKTFGKRESAAEGLSPAAAKATDGLIKEAIAAGKSATQVALEGKKSILDDIMAGGKNRPEVQEAMTRALEKDLGKLPDWSVHDNKATESIMGRFSTFFGQSHLRPLTLNAEGSMQYVMRGFDAMLEKMFKNVSPDDAKHALVMAQGVSDNAKLSGVAAQISSLMDNLVGHAKGESVAFRAGVDMDLLNKWLEKNKGSFRFSKGKVKNLRTMQMDDLSNGADWLDSWRYAKLGDKETTQQFLTKAFASIHSATMERSVFDDMASRFGSKYRGGEYTTKIAGHPYLDGYYWPADIAKEIPRFVRDWTLIGRKASPWAADNKVGPFLDRGQSMWKSAVTIYRPAHHIRNQVSDMYLGWIDGVNTLKPYRLAARVQRHMGGYDTMLDVERLIEVGVMGPKMGAPKAGEVLFRNKSGVAFTAENIEDIANKGGLLLSARSFEDIIDMGEKGIHKISLMKPAGGRVQKVARTAAELQSYNARLAHLIDKLMKSRGSDIGRISEEAVRRARKWHPTGLDLTQFERKYLRRIMPFYAWMRKSAPLMLEGLVMNPGKTVIPSKLYDAIQEAMGIETPGRQDPFPTDQLFPSWLKDQGIGPISESEGILGKITNQSIPSYAMGGMGLNPFTDTISQYSGVDKTLRSLGSSITPIAQIPAEIAFGQKFYTGEPIRGLEARPGAMAQYIGENIPIWESFQDIIGKTPFGTDTKRVQKGLDRPNYERLINWFTAAGISGTGQYQASARFEAMQPYSMEQRLSREAMLRRLQDGNP